VVDGEIGPAQALELAVTAARESTVERAGR
jgi:hypothetical protein